MEWFACSTRIVSGVDALEALGDIPCRKLLVVTAPELCQAGMAEQVKRVACQAETIVFENTGAVPAMGRAVEGGSRLRAFRPDLVVALGEEGTLDLAKAMVCFSRQNCPLAVIPTGAGSPAAVTSRVTLAHNGQLHLLQKGMIRPDLVVLDPQMAVKSPKTAVAEDGFSMLAAALESHAAAQEGLLSGFHAREGFAACWGALPAAFAGKAHAHQRLLTASVLTGLAVESTGLGLCRAMSNSLEAVFGLSGGKAAAILLPAVVACNAHAAGSRYAVLSRAAGLGGSREEIGCRNLKMGLLRLRRELGLPGTLVQAGVDLRQIWNESRRVVKLTLEDPECRNNPVAVDDFLVRRILEEITGRI